MKQPLFPPSIAGVFLLSLAYWLYLSLTTSMVIVFDAVGYESLGRMIYTQGWVSYFTTGPNNEPVYPLLVATSMAFEHITGVAFVKIMAIFGVIIMFLTQALTYKILRLLNIRNGICVLVLAYLGLSPALNNSAFSLYSEIATYPFILGIVLTSFYTWEAIKHNKKHRALFYSMLLGILLTSATLIKGVFECIAPVYVIIFFTTVFFQPKASAMADPPNGGDPPSAETDKAKKITTLLLCLAATVSFFYAPITGYKWLNLHYNGNFAITNRGPWALYGNTARRMESLTLKRFAEALAFVPGEGVCNNLFGPKECDFWSYRKSDEFGYAKLGELNQQHLPPEKINTTLLGLSAQKALENPFQYTLLTFLEGLKMFFWESTKIGFVNYPHWLQKIYDIKIFNNGLRFFASLVSLIAVLSIWLQSLTLLCHPEPPIKTFGGKLRGGSHLAFLIGALIFLYILFFSFFFILTRYALPIAPLYLISIGIWINQNLSPHAKNH